MMHFRRHRVW